VNIFHAAVATLPAAEEPIFSTSSQRMQIRTWGKTISRSSATTFLNTFNSTCSGSRAIRTNSTARENT